MKVAILLAVCILCGESKLESEFTGASTPALESPIGTADRHKRQVGLCADQETRLRFTLARCDPNYGQRLVDIYLDCNADTRARGFVGSCSRNENGRYCYELDLNVTSLQLNCPSLNTYSDYICTDMCRAALESLRSNFGCCLNSLFNISEYDSYYQFTNAGLWSACSVSPPGFCQATNLTLNSGTTSRNCSREDILEQTLTQVYCNSQIYQPILDIYQQCESPAYELSIAQCGLSETNQFCGLLISNETHPRAVESQCQNYIEGCTPSCYAALNSFKEAFGCCVNFYNTSIYGNYLKRNTTNPDLWSACGIPTPGFCTSTLSSQPTVPPTTRVSPMTLQPTSSSESSAVPNITMMLVLLVLLYMQV